MKFLLIALLSFPLFVQASNTCGIYGPLAERIQDCGTTQGFFKLVMRTDDNEEIWLDSTSGMIWGDVLSQQIPQKLAIQTCNTSMTARTQLDASWRLPTQEEFKEVMEHGAKTVLPNLDYWVWTSKIHIDFPVYAWLFNGEINRGYYGHRNSNGSLRCVTKLSSLAL